MAIEINDALKEEVPSSLADAMAYLRDAREEAAEEEFIAPPTWYWKTPSAY